MTLTAQQPAVHPIATSPRARGVALLVVLFFASGAAGLMYEVIWNRLLTLEMGGTAYSLATILTVFMGGLALGSWLGGRFSKRITNPMVVYGVLEAFIGLYCLALPLIIAALGPAMAFLYRNYYSSLVTFNLMQFVLCGLVMIVPVTLMGATLPIVAKHATRSGDAISGAVGLVYAVNTIGAFAGCVAAGLALLPVIGVWKTNAIAASVSVGAGLIAIIAGRLLAARPQNLSPSVEAHGVKAPIAPPKRQFGSRWSEAPQREIPIAVLLLGFGLSGAAAMTYQVAWTRVFTLSIGSATYAFTIIVAAFILGLALGSAVLGRLGDRARLTMPLLIGSQVAIAVMGALLIPLMGELPLRIAITIARNSDNFVGLQAAEFTTIFVMVLPSTFLMGGTLPLVCREIAARAAVAKSVDVGAVVGRAYVSNTIGTILGSFCAGFVLIPLVGMRGAIVAGVAMNAMVGTAFLLSGGRGPLVSRLALAAVCGAGPVALALSMPRWDRAVTTSAPYVYALDAVRASDGTADGIRELVRSALKVIHYEEGVSAIVTVTERPSASGAPERFLHVSGKRDASQHDPTQAMLAHLPLVLHPAPKSALVIGLGSGGTLASALAHPSLEHIDCVEISPEVRNAAVAYFGRGPSVADPRVRMIMGDGRLHLAMTDRKYDVIISQPSNPWMVGASSLFTRDAFELMKRRLEPGGIACIWMQGFNVSPESVRTLANTFHSVFEHMDIWESRVPSDFFMTGYNAPFPIDPVNVRERMSAAGVGSELAGFSVVDVTDLLGHWIGDENIVSKRVEGSPISTDDLNVLAARVPKELLKNRWVEVMDDWRQLRKSVSRRVSNADPAFMSRADAIFASKAFVVDYFLKGAEDQKSVQAVGALVADIARVTAAGGAIPGAELNSILDRAAAMNLPNEAAALIKKARESGADAAATLRRLGEVIQASGAEQHNSRVTDLMQTLQRIGELNPRDPNVVRTRP